MKKSFLRIGCLLLCLSLMLGLLACGKSDSEATTAPSESEDWSSAPSVPTVSVPAEPSDPSQPETEPSNPSTEPSQSPTTAPSEPSTAPSEEPTTPSEEVTAPSEEPTVKPTEPTVKPTEPTVKPTEPTVKPTEPTVKPTEPTVKPTEPTTKPTEPTTKPTEPSQMPTDPVVKPSEPVEVPDIPAGNKVIEIGKDPLPYDEIYIYHQLFDKENRVEVDIQMSDAELAKMQRDFEKNHKSPIYRVADVSIKISSGNRSITYIIRDVGVRMKGNTSRTDFYSPDKGGIYKAIHLKLDFQETFDDKDYYGSEARQWPDKAAKDARKDRTFATLEKLEMRWNKCYDSTYLKETYAYELYRSQGVLAPLTNLCSFDWSGNHMGVYTINEPVDKVFLEKRLPAEDLGGDLYKLGWTNAGATFTNLDSIGIEDEWNYKFYIYDLKTNKKTSQHESLKNLITKLNSGKVTKESFAELVDVNNFLHYAAVSYFLGNPDDLRSNYNNCYLYFLGSSGKAIIIPYDYDRCLGITYEYDPSGNGMTQENPFEGLRGNDQRNPLYLYTTDKGGYYVKEFVEILKKVAEDPLLKPQTFEAMFNQFKATYGGDVRPSKEIENMSWRKLDFSLDSSDGGNRSFASYINTKMQTFNRYMAKADDYIDYERPEKTIYYIRGEMNGWQDKPEYGMKIVDGKATITLYIGNNQRFKVYNSVQQLWYGTVDISPDTTVEYSAAGNHDNILLKPGRYVIEFDTETLQITIKNA